MSTGFGLSAVRFVWFVWVLVRLLAYMVVFVRVLVLGLLDLVGFFPAWFVGCFLVGFMALVFGLVVGFASGPLGCYLWYGRFVVIVFVGCVVGFDCVVGFVVLCCCFFLGLFCLRLCAFGF